MSTKHTLDNPQIDCRASYTTYQATEEVVLRATVKTFEYPEDYWWIVERYNGEHIIANLDQFEEFYTI